jgi:hypothetical protein
MAMCVEPDGVKALEAGVVVMRAVAMCKLKAADDFTQRCGANAKQANAL